MRVELDAQAQTITVDGVAISLDLLKALANPKPERVFRLTRAGDVVTAETITRDRCPLCPKEQQPSPMDEWKEIGHCDDYSEMIHVPCDTRIVVLMGHAPICPKCEPEKFAEAKRRDISRLDAEGKRQ